MGFGNSIINRLEKHLITSKCSDCRLKWIASILQGCSICRINCSKRECYKMNLFLALASLVQLQQALCSPYLLRILNLESFCLTQFVSLIEQACLLCSPHRLLRPHLVLELPPSPSLVKFHPTLSSHTSISLLSGFPYFFLRSEYFKRLATNCSRRWNHAPPLDPRFDFQGVLRRRQAPIYYSLAHMGSWWGHLQEMNKMKPGTQNKAGYLKIYECARASKEGGFDWTWIDTCSIDKPLPILRLR